MSRWLLNVALLSRKELNSLLRDVALMALIIFCFTLAVYSVAKGVKAEVSNASVAILDGDHSDLSRRLRHAIRPPYFNTPVDIARPDVAAALDRGNIYSWLRFRRASKRMCWPAAHRRCNCSWMRPR